MKISVLIIYGAYSVHTTCQSYFRPISYLRVGESAVTTWLAGLKVAGVPLTTRPNVNAAAVEVAVERGKLAWRSER